MNSPKAKNREAVEALAAEPSALPFLPLLYVAWADGDLDDGEIEQLRRRVNASDGLSQNARALLDEWLRADQPPSPGRLRQLLEALHARAKGLSTARRVSLAELGVELSDSADETDEAALRELEDALGIAGIELLREILPTADEPSAGAREGFDPASMQRLLDGERRSVRERVRELLQQPEFARDAEATVAQRREQTLVWCRRIADEGLGSISYPIEHGGEDDMGAFCTVFEMLAFFDLGLTIKFGVQFGLFGGSIRALGTESHHRAYLRKAGTLELPGCFAMTELGHGSNVADLETEVVYDAATDELVVHTPSEAARKEYIGNAACHGRLATVFGQLLVDGASQGVHAVLVPIRREDGSLCDGVRIEDCGVKLGLNGVDNGRMWFERVRVPRENLLDRYAEITPEGEYRSSVPSPSKRFFTMIGSLVAGRVNVALAALSAMKTGLAIAVRYGENRRQFGPPGKPETPLLNYLTHQRRLLPRVATAYALDFALKDLTRRFLARDEKTKRAIEGRAAGLKAYTTWCNLEALQTARECCGGQGYLAVNRFADLKADSDIFVTFEGDNTVLLQLVAKGLLSRYRRQFEDMRPATALRYLARRAADAVGEPSPLQARSTDSDHLRSLEFQREAFEYRELRLLGSAARRLKSRIDAGVESFDAFNQCQDHLVRAALAHVERLILDAFAAGVDDCADPTLRAMLTNLRDLWALERIEADSGWFLEAGFVSTTKSRAIRTEVNALCGEIRPDAVALVDSFGIPDALLGAPIAIGPPSDSVG